jgi:hypothetical protein
MAKKATPQFGGANPANNEGMREAQIWMRDLVKWCEQVRRDIVRLEGATHLSKGDPGQPPEEPWE